MKLTIQREHLASFCAASKPITSGKSSNSFTLSVHVTVAGNKAVFSSTNLESWVRQSFDLIGDNEDGVVMLPAELVGEIASLSTADKVAISCNGANLLIVAGSDKWKLGVTDPADFPVWKELEKKGEVIVTASDFRAGLDKLQEMAAKEKGRYALNGVHLSAKDGTIEMCGTDGRRLGYVKHPCRGGLGENTAIIPQAGCNLFHKLIPDGEVALVFSENSVVAKVAGLEVLSRLVEGQFPDYKTVVPTSLPRVAKFEKSELRPALLRSKLMTTPESSAVLLELSNGCLTIKSRASGHGESEVTCVANYDGEPFAISLDPSYVITAIDAGDWDAIELNMLDKETAVVIHGGHKDIEYYLVMPIDL
jgi:DNA polymerase-3 subunit beta